MRTDTAIGENPVSVAFAAVSLAKQIFADLHRSQALLIGAGETISLVARHLHDQGVKRIVVANRTLERASQLAEQFGAHAVLLADIPQELAHSDIVISSTASQLPILGRGAVERAQAAQAQTHVHGRHRRAARHRAGSGRAGRRLPLPWTICTKSSGKPQEPPGRGPGRRELVSAGADDFMQRLRELAAVDVLKAYRQQAERLRDEELAKAQRLLAAGGNAEDVLAQLARGLTNKLLHAPSVQLEEISADGRYEALAVAQNFALDEGPSKTKASC